MPHVEFRDWNFKLDELKKRRQETSKNAVKICDRKCIFIIKISKFAPKSVHGRDNFPTPPVPLLPWERIESSRVSLLLFHTSPVSTSAHEMALRSKCWQKTPFSSRTEMPSHAKSSLHQRLLCSRKQICLGKTSVKVHIYLINKLLSNVFCSL